MCVTLCDTVSVTCMWHCDVCDTHWLHMSPFCGDKELVQCNEFILNIPRRGAFYKNTHSLKICKKIEYMECLLAPPGALCVIVSYYTYFQIFSIYANIHRFFLLTMTLALCNWLIVIDSVDSDWCWFILIDVNWCWSMLIDADAVTPSSNTRSYTRRSVPSFPGESFLGPRGPLGTPCLLYTSDAADE